MPELPEVETIKNDLAGALAGRTIADVEVRLPKMVRSNRRVFRRRVRGRRIGSLARRGKLLIVGLDGRPVGRASLAAGDDAYLLIHLKMTGQLIYRRRGRVIAGGHSQKSMSIDELPNKHTHFIFSLTDGSRLFFNDLRQFGYVKLVGAQELADELSGYGAEPLEESFTADWLHDSLRRRVCLKSVLLDQSVIAGLGNIYADEACWRARVRPTRRADRLTRSESASLARSIRQVLQLAIKYRGTTFSNFRDGLGRTGNFGRRLNVYGRAGQACRRCRTIKLSRVTVSGRGTVFCSRCQR